MRSKVLKRSFALFVAGIIILASVGTGFANGGTDYTNHWASIQIKSWEDQGLVRGYPDGSFKPNNSISRAEFMALVNRAFEYTPPTAINFKDVSSTDWFADTVAIARASGYIEGFEDQTMRPNNPISRQEVAVILGRILQLTGNPSGAQFKDSIPSWSAGSVGAVARLGLMVGFPDGTFGAAKPLTRAEAVVTLDRALSQVSEIYRTAGIYGPESGMETITKNVIVTAPGVTLQNLQIEGNLTIARSVGEGNVTFNNVSVKGTMFIRGGGENSIYVNDSTLGQVTVNKENGKLRVQATGSTSIGELTVNSSVQLEEKDITGPGFSGIIVSSPRDSTVFLVGIFESVMVNTDNVTIHVPSNSKIKTIMIGAKSNIIGEGTIEVTNFKLELGSVKKFYFQLDGDIITDAIDYEYPGYVEVGLNQTHLPAGINGGWWKLINGVPVEFPELRDVPNMEGRSLELGTIKKFYFQLDGDIITDAIEYEFPGYVEVGLNRTHLPAGINGGWWKLINGVPVEFPELRPSEGVNEGQEQSDQNTEGRILELGSVKKFYFKLDGDIITDAIDYEYPGYVEVGLNQTHLPAGINGGWWKLINGVPVEFPELRP